ncbi:MAG: hypothetical protein AAFV80_23550 [Bacteroidota bacterium]
MQKNYQYFHNLLIAWFQGHKTGIDIKAETNAFLNLGKYEEELDLFVDALEESINKYDDDIGYEWEQYKEYAKDTAPTVQGLCHNIGQVVANHQSMEDFLDWATWHNIDCGESTSGVFENDNIDHFCLTFLPEHEDQLDSSLLLKAIPIIKESNQLSHDEFVQQISALI